MNLGFLTSGIITIITLVCTCGITLVVLGVTGFFLYRMFKGMSQNKNLVKTGVAAPAVIIDVQDTGVTMNDSPQARLTLQVTPANRPPFQAVTTAFVGRFQIGTLTPGATVQVRFDPNDISKVAIESLGGGMPSANFEQIQTALQKQDQYYEQLRKTGEEAQAKIVTATDMNMRVGDNGAMVRFTFEVMPYSGEPFQAESQAAIADSSRYKYSVGKTIYVRYDPANKAQVAIDRAE